MSKDEVRSYDEAAMMPFADEVALAAGRRVGSLRSHALSEAAMMRVDLGCGVNKPEGFIGVDRIAAPGVDIVYDLTEGVPFADDDVDLLRARDFFEHMPDTIAIFNECWRVLKAGGLLELEVPRFPHVDAVKDPTHVKFFTVETFTEYLAGPDRLEAEYGMRLWNIDRITQSERRIWAVLTPRGK